MFYDVKEYVDSFQRRAAQKQIDLKNKNLKTINKEINKAQGKDLHSVSCHIADALEEEGRIELIQTLVRRGYDVQVHDSVFCYYITIKW